MKSSYLFVFVVLAGCHANHSEKEMTTLYALEDEGSAFTEVLKEEYSFEYGRKTELQTSSSTHAQDRKIIRQGWLHFQTKDPTTVRAQVKQLCVELDAYIANEDQRNHGRGISYEQTIRIPSTTFDDFFRKIEELAQETEKRQVTTRDVTEEFIDLKSRIGNQKNLEKRYLDLLDKGKLVEELLTIEKELARVRTEIESMEGKLAFLNNQVSFCTLHLIYYEEPITRIAVGPGLHKAFKRGFESLVFLSLAILSIWPFVIIITIGIWGYLKYRKRKLTDSPA